jgi:RsiW-degrading membrane proteinase PrsW (M82 family)
LNQSTGLLTAAKTLTLAIGIVLAIIGGLAAVVYLVQLILSAGAIPLDSALAAVSIAALGLGLGGTLAWQSVNSIAGRSSRPFSPPSIWLLLLLYVVALSAGQLIISLDLFPALLFPPLHAVAAAIPPLAVLAFAGRSLRNSDLRWREISLQLSGGAFLATTLAFIAEILVAGFLLIIAVSITALTPSGRALIDELLTNLQSPLWFEDPANLERILLLPPVLVTIILVFVVLAPIIEELAKLIPVALMSYRLPALGQALVWGLASGAGFALVENLFNTLLAVDIWAVVMLLRIGGSTMHAFGAGLTAMGWQSFLRNRRPWKLLGAYIVAVISHAVWNGAVVGIAGISLLATGTTAGPAQFIAGAGALSLLVLLVLLTVGLIAAIVFVTYRVRAVEDTGPSQATT